MHPVSKDVRFHAHWHLKALYQESSPCWRVRDQAGEGLFFSGIIYASVCWCWWSGLVGVAELRSWQFALRESRARSWWLQLRYFLWAAQTEPSRDEGGGGEERDGREQLRDERLRSPQMFGPFFGGAKRFGWGRSIEMDSTKCRGDLLFNNETDAVSRPKIISLQTEPSWPRARLWQGKC